MFGPVALWSEIHKLSNPFLRDAHAPGQVTGFLRRNMLL